VRAFSLHPGCIVSTDLKRYRSEEEVRAAGVTDEHGKPILDPAKSLKTAEQGAATSVWRATSPRLDGLDGLYCQDRDIAPLVPPQDKADPGISVIGSAPLGAMPYAVHPLRGGGGSFGVVTAIELRLFPVTQLYGGILWYPIERGAQVLHAWHELTRGEIPDELTTLGRFLRVPPLPELPAEIRGKSFILVEVFHLGDPARADELLSPLRALRPVNDTVTTLPIAALPHVHMDPDQPVAGVGDGMMLASLPGEAIDALVATAGSNAGFPLSSVEIRHLGGELSHRRRGDGVITSLQAPYLLFAASITPVPDLLAPSRAQIQTVKDALAPWAAHHMYLNFAETPRAASTLWPEHAYRRLRQIKASVDPHDVILSNHPVPPAR
jgi:hypothetical protein